MVEIKALIGQVATGASLSRAAAFSGAVTSLNRAATSCWLRPSLILRPYSHTRIQRPITDECFITRSGEAK